MEDGSISTLKEKNKSKLPHELIIGIRPENITENGLKNKQSSQVISSNIDIIEPAGSDTFVMTKLGNTEVTARFHSETKVKVGSKVNLLI